MHSHSDGPPAKENNACLCQTGLAACKHSSRKSCSSKIPFPQATLGRSLLFYFQGLKKLKSNYSKSVFKYSELQIYTYVVIHPCQGCMWIYRCNWPPALLAEWPGSFTCHGGKMGVEVCTLNKSQHTKRKFPCRSCKNSNLQPFDQKSGALSTNFPGCRCPGIVWEPIRKWAHPQFVWEHSARVVSAHWATTDWSWLKEWNWCAWANLQSRRCMNYERSNILPKSLRARRKPPPPTSVWGC